MSFPGRRARISVLISALLLLGLLVPVVDQFFFRYDWANTTLEDVDRRYARLLGLRDAGPEIAKALGQARAELVRHAYPLDLGPDRVGADLQQRVRQIAERAGAEVVGSQILPIRSAEFLEVVPLGLTLEADMASLRDFLAGLAGEQPAIQVESSAVTSQRQRGGRGEGKVRVQLQLNAVRLVP